MFQYADPHRTINLPEYNPEHNSEHNSGSLKLLQITPDQICPFLFDVINHKQIFIHLNKHAQRL